MEYPPSDRRTGLRNTVLVTQIKMGDERRYFFGYAKNISRSGVFVQTISPKDVGEVFDIEFTIPREGLTVKCKARVIWNRRFSEAGNYEPGMGLRFEDIDPAFADSIEAWVIKEREAAEESS